MKKIIIAAVVILLIAGAGGWYYYAYGPCGKAKVSESVAEMHELLTSWVDAESVASQTPRMALSGQISTLQGIKREADALVVPGCLLPSKNELTRAMESSIGGYISFLGQEKEVIIDSYFEAAKNHTKSFSEGLAVVSKCAPFCR